MLKVYLAAPYSWKEQMQAYREELSAMNVEVTSRWLDEPHKSTTQIGDLAREEFQKYAIQDINDVRYADILVFFTDPTKTIVRGGRHVEFGVALERDMEIYVLGSEENIFHYLPSVTHFENWEQIKNALQRMA